MTPIKREDLKTGRTYFDREVASLTAYDLYPTKDKCEDLDDDVWWPNAYHCTTDLWSRRVVAKTPWLAGVKAQLMYKADSGSDDLPPPIVLELASTRPRRTKERSGVLMDIHRLDHGQPGTKIKSDLAVARPDERRALGWFLRKALRSGKPTRMGDRRWLKAREVDGRLHVGTWWWSPAGPPHMTMVVTPYEDTSWWPGIPPEDCARPRVEVNLDRIEALGGFGEVSLAMLETFDLQSTLPWAWIFPVDCGECEECTTQTVH